MRLGLGLVIETRTVSVLDLVIETETFPVSVSMIPDITINAIKHIPKEAFLGFMRLPNENEAE